MSEVQALELQIKDNASKAARGLNTLADSLERIKTHLSGFSALNQLADNLGRFSNALSNAVGSNKVNRLNSISGAFKELGNSMKSIDKMKTAFENFGELEGVSKNIGKFAAGIANAVDDTQVARLNTVAEAFNKIAAAASGLRSVGTTLAKVMQTDANGGLAGSALAKKPMTWSDGTREFQQNEDGTWTQINQVAEDTRELTLEMEHARDMANQAADAVGNVGNAMRGGSGGGFHHGTGGINMSLEDARERVLDLVENETELDRLRNKVDALQESLAQDIARGGLTAEQRSARVAQIQKLMNQAEKLEAKRPLSEAAQQRIAEQQREQLNAATQAAQEQANQLLNNNPAQMMQMRIDSMREKLTTGIRDDKLTGEQQASLAEKIQNLEDKLARYNEEQQRASTLSARFESAIGNLKSGLGAVKTGFKNLKDSLFSASGGLLSFLHGMTRIAKYRLFRAVIREITEAFKTGLENYRKYSKAIGGSYSNDMDRLDDSLLKMKNSIGAALAPAIQALLPWIQRAISGFIELVNWVNQFFALLRGQKTWSKAVDVSAADFEETKKGAKGAAAAMKNLLASWDELNIIQSQSGGSGSGSGAENLEAYETMFEEVETFDGSVKETVEWLQDHLDLANKALETLLLRLAGFKFSAIAVALALKDIYFEADEMGRAGASLEETLKNSVDKVLLGALGAAAIGFSLAPSGTKLTGALIGFSVGASISLGLAVVKWAEGVESQGVVVEGFLEYLRNDVIGLIFPVLAAVALGAFVAGGTGALVALPLGAAISLGIAAVDWKSENELGKKPDFDEEDLRNSLGMTAKKYLNETAGGIAGGILGTQIAPGIGTLIGVTAGVLLGLAVTRMQYEKELSKIRNAQQQAQLFGPMHYDVQSMLDESTFGVSAKVMASFNVLKTSNEDLNEAREKVEEEAKKLEGTFKLTVGVKGFGDMTDQELSDLRTAADNYVKALKGEIEAEKATLKVSMQLIDPTDSSYLELKSSNEFLWKWLGIKEDMITKVGNAIGKYLGQGAVDEFKKEMPEIIKAIQTVTSFLSERKMGSEVAYNANELHEAFRSGKMDKESYDAYVKAYGEQKSGTRQTLLETYKKQYLGALEAYETAYGVLNDPEVKASLEKLGYDTSIYTEEFLKQAEEALKVYGENGSNIPKLVDEIIARIYKNADATFEADKLAVLQTYIKNANRVQGADYRSGGAWTSDRLKQFARVFGIEGADTNSNRKNFEGVLNANKENPERLAETMNRLIYTMVYDEIVGAYGEEMGEVFSKNYATNLPGLYKFVSGSDYLKSYIHDMFAQLGLTNDATIDKYIYQLLGGKGEGGIASFWGQYLPGAKGWGNSYNSLLSGLLGKGLANINGKWSIGYDFARDLREDMGLVNYDSIRNAIMGGDKTAFESFARDAAVQLVRNVLGDESAFELTNDLKNNPNLLYSMIEPELLYKMLFPAGYNGNVTYDVFQKMLEGFGVGKGGYIPTMNRSYNSGEAGGYGNEGAESEEDKDKAKGSEQIKQTGHLEEMDKTLKDMKQNGIPVRLTAGPRLAKLVNDSFRQIGKPLFENLNG